MEKFEMSVTFSSQEEALIWARNLIRLLDPRPARRPRTVKAEGVSEKVQTAPTPAPVDERYKGMGKGQKIALALFREEPGLVRSTAEVARITGGAAAPISARLSNLVERGLLIQVSRGKWMLAPEEVAVAPVTETPVTLDVSEETPVTLAPVAEAPTTEAEEEDYEEILRIMAEEEAVV